MEIAGHVWEPFLLLQVPAKPGATVTLQVQKGDAIVASADGKLLKGKADKAGTHVTFTMPADATELVALYENLGASEFSARRLESRSGF